MEKGHLLNINTLWWWLHELCGSQSSVKKAFFALTQNFKLQTSFVMASSVYTILP